jgi:hypothetical protein
MCSSLPTKKRPSKSTSRPDRPGCLPAGFGCWSSLPRHCFTLCSLFFRQFLLQPFSVMSVEYSVAIHLAIGWFWHFWNLRALEEWIRKQMNISNREKLFDSRSSLSLVACSILQSIRMFHSPHSLYNILILITRYGWTLMSIMQGGKGGLLYARSLRQHSNHYRNPVKLFVECLVFFAESYLSNTRQNILCRVFFKLCRVSEAFGKNNLFR